MSDSKEVATHDTWSQEVASARSESDNFLSALIQAARDPSIDASKVTALANVAISYAQERREQRQQDLRSQFNEDKAAALFEMPAIFKRGKSDKHRYAKFEDLHRAVLPILRKHNLVLNFKLGSMPNGHIAVTPVLSHRNGLDEAGETLTGPPDTGPGRSAIQAVGSSGSYLKRHSAKAILNLIEDGEDTDGVMLPDDQLNDRQARLAEQAELAAASGDYAEWFDKQPTRDRAWLISTGRHAQFGGAPALPGASGLPPREPDAEQLQRASQNQKRTPAQLVDAYIEGVGRQETLADLNAYQTEPQRAKFLATIREKHPDLFERVSAANADRYTLLKAAEQSTGAEDQ
jgi:hypothetical protein